MARLRQEIQEPHKPPRQAAGGRRNQGQESLFLLRVVEAVFIHLALGSVDEHAIGVLSMPNILTTTTSASMTTTLPDPPQVFMCMSVSVYMCVLAIW